MVCGKKKKKGGGTNSNGSSEPSRKRETGTDLTRTPRQGEKTGIENKGGNYGGSQKKNAGHTFAEP